MNKHKLLIIKIILLAACGKIELNNSDPNNPEIYLEIPRDFPEVNSAFDRNRPTKYGVQLGEKLFTDKRLSANNTISCSSCHNRTSAFADNNPLAIGIYNRLGIRNSPPIQNLAFMKYYNWDGSKLDLESQAIIPIITHEEMASSIFEVIEKINGDMDYVELFRKTFGDDEISPDRIYRSIAQYEYSLISSNSKYDQVIRKNKGNFSLNEERGFKVFKQKCMACHSTELFTDQSFRNIGFPINTNSNEAGRARITGELKDYMNFRVPSLRNVEYTAPYGSFGQFTTLKELLDYLDNGVIETINLDPILKNNGNRIPLSEQEKNDIISFLSTLSDLEFTKREK